MFTKQKLSPEESKALEAFYQTETGNKIVINQETLKRLCKTYLKIGVVIYIYNW
jgi:hypothetical protein